MNQGNDLPGRQGPTRNQKEQRRNQTPTQKPSQHFFNLATVFGYFSATFWILDFSISFRSF